MFEIHIFDQNSVSGQFFKKSEKYTILFNIMYQTYSSSISYSIINKVLFKDIIHTSMTTDDICTTLNVSFISYTYVRMYVCIDIYISCHWLHIGILHDNASVII